LRSEKNLIIGVLLSIIMGNIVLLVFMSSLLARHSAEQLSALRREKEVEIINELKGRVESASSIIGYFATIVQDTDKARLMSVAAVTSLRLGFEVQWNDYVKLHIIVLMESLLLCEVFFRRATAMTIIPRLNSPTML
jgi:hypothetical protein